MESKLKGHSGMIRQNRPLVLIEIFGQNWYNKNVIYGIAYLTDIIL
jgi:hypothetical protein